MKLGFPLALFFVVFTSHALATQNSFVKHRSHALQHGLISPKLDPESDKVFFGHDYPDNLAAKGQLKPGFGHPYPAVQDSDKFDKDYVKDENSDNGEWKAQMEYDLLRTKVSKAKDDMEKAKAAKEAAQDRLKEARNKQTEAEKEAGITNEKVAKARAEEKTAEKDANAAKEATEKAEEEEVEDMRKAVDAEGKAGSKDGTTGGQTGGADSKDGKKGSGKTSDSTDAAETGAGKSGENTEDGSSANEPATKVEAATTKVKKEMTDLEKCEKELEKARAKLKELVEKQDKLAKDKKQHSEERKAQLEEAKKLLSKEESEASAEKSQAEKDAASLEEEEKGDKLKLSEQEKAHEAALAKAKLESTDLDKLESDMKVAEQNLRKFRRAEDADGGVYNKKKVAGEPCIDPAALKKLQGQDCVKSDAIAHKASAAFVSVIVAALTMFVL